MLTRRHFLTAGAASTVSLGAITTATAAGSSDVRPAFGVGKPMRPNAVKARWAPNTYTTTLPDIGPDATWQDVRAVQHLLLAQGFKVASWETVYGPHTRAAVLAFQRRYNLPGSGIAIAATMARLTLPTSPGQNTYRTYAIQTLLKKHGYRFGQGAAPGMNTVFDANTAALVQGFQTSHGLGGGLPVGPLNWATLFAGPTCGPVYPVAQAGTGPAQWNNCGPASAVALLLSRNTTPKLWAWNADSAYSAASINRFRYVAMGVPATPTRDGQGTSIAELRRGFGAYGLTNTPWVTLAAGMADVREGYGIILNGDAHRLPWPTRTRGPSGHWITVLGFDGTNYLAVDPISAPGSTILHRISDTQLGTYVAGKYGNTTTTSALLVH